MLLIALAIDGEEGPFVVLSLAIGLNLNLKAGLQRIEILWMEENAWEAGRVLRRGGRRG